MTDTHIKIKPVTPKVQYTGNGVTTVFPYEFPIFDETDIVVYVGDDIIESGYSVSGAGETDGGNVTFDTAPDDGAKITLLRNVPIERLTDFQEGGTFRPKNLNDEFDRQTAFVQQVQETLDRTVKVSPTSDVDPEEVLSQVERVYESIDNVDAVADSITNVDTVATNISDVGDCADNMAAILDAPNQAASASESAALAYQYANDKINQTHISNCITYIPQDIKLELNNGTLTLKAGSKVYVPNGDGVFDTITIANDLTISSFSGSYTRTIFVDSTGTSMLAIFYCYSGASAPTVEGTNAMWYDTTNNLVKRTTDSGSTWTTGYSLPICLVTSTSSVATSLDKVFNGFGYVGSTVFALPNIKGLFPNGRNADGSLNNTEFQTTSVLTNTITSTGTGMNLLRLNSTDFTRGQIFYNENLNYNYVTSFSAENFREIAFVGSVYYVSGKIVNLNVKPVFHSLDYNDTYWIAKQALPSTRSVELTIPASASSVTAPEDGYLYFSARPASTGNFRMTLINSTTNVSSGFVIVSPPTSNTQYIYIPVNKNDEVSVTYNNTTAEHLVFVYANGTK